MMIQQLLLWGRSSMVWYKRPLPEAFLLFGLKSYGLTWLNSEEISFFVLFFLLLPSSWSSFCRNMCHLFFTQITFFSWLSCMYVLSHGLMSARNLSFWILTNFLRIPSGYPSLFSYLLFVNTQIGWRQKTGSGCKHATLFQIEKFEIPVCVIFWKEAERQLCEERKEIYRNTLERVCAWAGSSWGSFKRAREPLVSNETTSGWITACYQPSGERLGGQQRLRTH